MSGLTLMVMFLEQKLVLQLPPCGGAQAKPCIEHHGAVLLLQIVSSGCLGASLTSLFTHGGTHVNSGNRFLARRARATNNTARVAEARPCFRFDPCLHAT